jgi:hypothetical protein
MRSSSFVPRPNESRIGCECGGRHQERPVPFQAAAAPRQLQALVRRRHKDGGLLPSVEPKFVERKNE